MKKFFSIALVLCFMFAGTILLTSCGEIEKTALAANMLSLEYASVDYTGNAHTPNVEVTVDGDVINPEEYIVTYENNVNAGTAKVVVTAKSDSKLIEGKAETTFEILRISMWANDFRELKEALENNNCDEVKLGNTIYVTDNIVVEESKCVNLLNHNLVNNAKITNDGMVVGKITGTGTVEGDGIFKSLVSTYDDLTASLSWANHIELTSAIKTVGSGLSKTLTLSNETVGKNQLTIDLNGYDLEVFVYISVGEMTSKTISLVNSSNRPAYILGDKTTVTAIEVRGSGRTEENIKLNFENLLILGSCNALSTYTYFENVEIYAKDCVFLSDENCDSAVMLAANYNYTFENCIFEGYTGYQTEGGEHKLVNCTINGVGEPIAPEAKGSGSALIAVSADGEVSTLNIEIDGGVLTGIKHAIEEYNEDNVTPYAQITLKNNPILVAGEDLDVINSKNDAVVVE